MFYRIAIFCCSVYVRILFRLKYEGLENIPPKDCGFILASNHRHNFDPIFVAAPIPQMVHYMAKAELFKKRWMKWLMKHLKAFPVERGKGDTGAIEWAVGVIKSGDVLGMFPEGQRSEDGKPLRPKSGMAMIASQTHADILPCAVCFDGVLKFRSVVTVRFGNLIPYKELGFTEGKGSPREIKNTSRKIMDKIIFLLEGSK